MCMAVESVKRLSPRRELDLAGAVRRAVERAARWREREVRARERRFRALARSGTRNRRELSARWRHAGTRVRNRRLRGAVQARRDSVERIREDGGCVE